MGSKWETRNDWIRASRERYFAEEMDEQVSDAVQHVLIARSAAELGEDEIALRMYREAVRLWKEINADDPGHWKQEINATSREYASFVIDHLGELSQMHHA